MNDPRVARNSQKSPFLTAVNGCSIQRKAHKSF